MSDQDQPAADADQPTWDAERQRSVYMVLGLSAVVLLTAGTIVFHWLEDWSWVDSFYFCSVAVTTVGFGDLTPTTDGSKLFTVFYVFTGISIITTFLDARLKRHGYRHAARRSD